MRRRGRAHAPKEGEGRRRYAGRGLARFHRLTGTVAAAFVAGLALTGIALNHTEELALDARYVSSRWLLAWYGMTLPERVVSYRVGADWVSQVGERLYFNAREIEGEYPPLVGAVALPTRRVIGVEGRLLVLTAQGELIETLGGAHGVPAGMLALGVRDNKRLVVRAAHGDYLADEELLSWQESGRAIEAKWARPAEAPPRLRQSLLEAYRGRLLSVERVLRDLHSGRLLGRYGHLVMDLAAAGILLLAASGVWMWFLRNNRRTGGKS